MHCVRGGRGGSGCCCALCKLKRKVLLLLCTVQEEGDGLAVAHICLTVTYAELQVFMLVSLTPDLFPLCVAVKTEVSSDSEQSSTSVLATLAALAEATGPMNAASECSICSLHRRSASLLGGGGGQ